MESLSDQQQELIRKMSDERLRQSLLKAGLPPAAINILDRAACPRGQKWLRADVINLVWSLQILS